MKNKLSEFMVVGVGIVSLAIIFTPINSALNLFTKHQESKTIMDDNISTTNGINEIDKLQSKSVIEIEKKIDAMRTQSKEKMNFKSIFSNSVIMGDSISEGLTEYNMLEKSSVVAIKGRDTIKAMNDIKTVVGLQPQKVFMTYGMNDLLLFNGNSKSFIKQYEKLVNKAKQELPNTDIYICSVLPVQQKAINRKPAFKAYSQFNIDLQKMCKDLGVTYIKTDDLLIGHSEYYEGDGIHMKPKFYPVWLSRLYDRAF